MRCPARRTRSTTRACARWRSRSSGGTFLYIEGEPRWEYKFIRRSLEEGFAVRVASLLKTTPNKFYRQGVETPDELTDGFPTDELKLFALRRADDRQLRGRLAHARAAGHDPRVREPARRQPDDDGRPARSRRRRLGRDERRRGAARAAADARGPELRAQPREGACSRRSAARPRSRGSTRTTRRTSRRGSRCPTSRTSSTSRELKPGAEVLLEAQINGRNEPLLVHAALRPRQCRTCSRPAARGAGRCSCRTRISATRRSGASCSRRSRRARRSRSRSRRSRCSTATRAKSRCARRCATRSSSRPPTRP